MDTTQLWKREWAAIAQERIRQIKSGEVTPLDGEQGDQGNASTGEAVGAIVSFQLHPDARDELRQAVLFYGRAAERFVNAVETAIAAIVLNPDRFREFEPGVRTSRVSKFPYSIL